MLKTVISILSGVFVLSVIGEIIYSVSHSWSFAHGYYKIMMYVITVRWEVVLSHVFVSGLTLLVCLKQFDKLCDKRNEKD